MVKYVNPTAAAIAGEIGRSGKGWESSSAAHRPAEWRMRRRFAAAQFPMGIDPDGKPDIEHRARFRTPQTRGPPLSGRWPPQRVRRGRYISSEAKWGGGRLKGGLQEARPIGRTEGAALLGGRCCGKRGEFRTYARIFTPKMCWPPIRGGAQLGKAPTGSNTKGTARATTPREEMARPRDGRAEVGELRAFPPNT